MSRRIDYADNALHAAGGALLALLIPSASPLELLVAFTAWGMLREEAQRDERWLRAFVEAPHPSFAWRKPLHQRIRWTKIVEALSWGIGAALVAALR